MVNLMYRLTNSLFFDVPLLYYTNLNSSIICFLFSGDIYLSLSISISFPSVFKCNSFEAFWEDLFETLVILSAILLPMKWPVVSAVFWIALFEAVFIASGVDFLVLSRSFWLYLPLNFLATLVTCVAIFLAKDRNP